jgi:diaminohydroxyphosphoribosylaminopyrimidine deaminase/5-amino-6-(5-phosphoribosylamino)uracil reductase
MDDVEHMRRALEQAATVRSTTAPNPWVGSVVVPPDSDTDGGAVFAGATAPPGGPHAEVNALAAAGEAARGSTLYVTLEPCAHHGRTPALQRRHHRCGRVPGRGGHRGPR